jgi:uncharacterized protein
MPQVNVTVVWATADVQDVVGLTLARGTTVAEAVAVSGLAARYGIDLATARFAIDGRLVPEGTLVADGDRIELTRPLVVDPKEARRLRAEAKARAKAIPDRDTR